MQKIIYICLFFMVMIQGCTKSCSKDKTDADSVLKIGTNANFPPFESINEKGELIGFDIDLGRILGEKMNRNVVFKEFEFDGLILALNQGQIDIILSGMSITESRQKEIAMVPYQGEPLTEVTFIFWQNAPEGLTSLEDLKQYALDKKLSVSLQSGHFLEDVLKTSGVPLKLLPGSPEQILDIKYGKSLAAAIDVRVGKKLASEHQDLKLVTLPLPKDKWDLGNGVGIKKSRADLIDIITRTIDALKADGTITTLQGKWFKDGK